MEELNVETIIQSVLKFESSNKQEVASDPEIEEATARNNIIYDTK